MIIMIAFTQIIIMMIKMMIKMMMMIIINTGKKVQIIINDK